MSHFEFSDILIDTVAEVLYHNEAGLTDERYEKLMGKKRKQFYQPLMVSVPPEHQYWLQDHERYGYRWQAQAVLQLLVNKNLLRYPTSVKKEDL
jgi:hypothetical protein